MALAGVVPRVATMVVCRQMPHLLLFYAVSLLFSNLSTRGLAFRDRLAGSDRNRSRPTEDSGRGGSRGGPGARVRGGKLSPQPNRTVWPLLPNIFC